MHCAGGVCPGGVCLGGLPRGFLPWGVSARGDVADPPGPETDTPLWTEWQTGVKTLPCGNKSVDCKPRFTGKDVISKVLPWTRKVDFWRVLSFPHRVIIGYPSRMGSHIPEGYYLSSQGIFKVDLCSKISENIMNLRIPIIFCKCIL